MTYKPNKNSDWNLLGEYGCMKIYRILRMYVCIMCMRACRWVRVGVYVCVCVRIRGWIWRLLIKGKIVWKRKKKKRGRAWEVEGKKKVCTTIDVLICMSSRLGCIESRVLKGTITAQISIEIYYPYGSD